MNRDEINRYLFFRRFLSLFWINSGTEERRFPAVNFFLIVSRQLQMFLILIHVSANNINSSRVCINWHQLSVYHVSVSCCQSQPSLSTFSCVT